MTKRGGFTLIELLVAVAIIGILSTVVIVNVASARAKGRDAKRMADVETIATGLDMFRADKKRYPGTADGLAQSSPTWPFVICAADWGNSPDANWLTLTNLLVSNKFIPVMPTSNNLKKRYCNGTSANMPMNIRAEDHFQLFTALETPTGNTDQLADKGDLPSGGVCDSPGLAYCYVVQH